MSLKTTIAIPAKALDAAEKLTEALAASNAADGPYAYGADGAYGVIAEALKFLLCQMIDETNYPNGLYASYASAAALTFAEAVYSAVLDNGENVKYQITTVLGYELKEK